MSNTRCFNPRRTDALGGGGVNRAATRSNAMHFHHLSVLLNLPLLKLLQSKPSAKAFSAAVLHRRASSCVSTFVCPVKRGR